MDKGKWAMKEPTVKINPQWKGRKVQYKEEKKQNATAAFPLGTFDSDSGTSPQSMNQHIQKRKAIRALRSSASESDPNSAPQASVKKSKLIKSRSEICGINKGAPKKTVALPPGIFGSESEFKSKMIQPSSRTTMQCFSKSDHYDSDECVPTSEEDDERSDQDNETSGDDGSSDNDEVDSEACGDGSADNRAQDDDGDGDKHGDKDDASDDDVLTEIKVVWNRTDLPKPPPPQPKLHRFTQKMQLHFTGLSDQQINQYLSLRGFEDIHVGYAAMKGNVIVVKSGFVRMLVTRDHKSYVIPTSMTDADWNEINKVRTLLMKKLLVFITIEYVAHKFIKERRGNCRIPSDEEIIYKYCKRKVVTDTEVKWEYRPAHSAILLIDGLKFRLYDANSFADITESENFWIRDFYKWFKSRGLPHIYKAIGLKAKDAKDYAIETCYKPKGVDASCALYLLFLVEQMAEKQAIVDLNHTPALSQLYACKVNHFVGGLIDFDTFKRNNPHWPKIIPPFIFDSFLDELRDGKNISIRELNETKERIAHQISLEFKKRVKHRL